MSSGSSPGNPLLPVSISPAEDEKDKLLRGDEKEKIFRGSAMTKRGAYAAISYMACAVAGAVIAGVRDLTFDFYGYGVVFIANITTAIYLATIGRIGKSTGLNSFGLMWCNGVICGPVLLFWTLIRGDLTMTVHFSYCIFLNTTLNSAVTQTICGNLKDLFTIGIGWAVFGGLPFDVFNVLGQFLGFFGSGLYAYYKMKGR
ncbi:UDP-N-acetylglucosamine transporter UGNT1 [Linum perenne]